MRDKATTCKSLRLGIVHLIYIYTEREGACVYVCGGVSVWVWKDGRRSKGAGNKKEEEEKEGR